MPAHCRVCRAELSEGGWLQIAPAPSAAWAFVDRVDAPPADRGDLQIATCDSCGLTQRVGPAIATFREVHTAALLSSSMRAHREEQANAFIAHFGLTGQRVVEIGAGDGALLPLLMSCHVQAEGMEAGGARSTARPEVVIHDGYPGDPALAGRQWHAAWCLNFLEHAPDPVEFLKGIAALLPSEGPLLLEVPDYSQQRALQRATDYVADHLCYFTAETLTTTLSMAGFIVRRLKTVRGGENLEVWATRRARLSHDAEAQRIVDIRDAVTRSLQQMRGTAGQVAVWGASHQALLILATSDPRDLDCVIDSSPAKQGRFTPVSRLPIVAPDPDLIRSLAGVLIVASGFEQEIAMQLRAHGFVGQIAALQGTQVVALHG